MLWFLTGIPVGLCHQFILVILKGCDPGGTMAVLFLNLLMAGVTSGRILACRLLMAAGYLAEAMTAGIVRMAKWDTGNDRVRQHNDVDKIKT